MNNVNIDYLTFTINDDLYTEPETARGWPLNLAYLTQEILHYVRTDFSPTNPAKRYEYAITCSITGVRIDAAIGRQGIRVQMPGAFWLENRQDQLVLLGYYVKEVARKITRIDVAFDYKSEAASAARTAEEYWLEHGIEGIKKTKLISSKNGSTFYIGSRQSERMLRVYDKGLQLGDDPNWRRCEIEIKGATAHRNAENLSQSLAPAVLMMAEVLGTMTSSLSTELTFLLDGIQPEIIPEPKRVSNRYKWMCEQVTPAFAHLAKDNPQEALQVVEFMLRKILEVLPPETK